MEDIKNGTTATAENLGEAEPQPRRKRMSMRKRRKAARGEFGELDEPATRTPILAAVIAASKLPNRIAKEKSQREPRPRANVFFQRAAVAFSGG